MSESVLDRNDSEVSAADGTTTTKAWSLDEIRDGILDYLHDDAGTLAACSLVCTQWLRTARYHLFQRIQVDRSRQMKRFSRLLEAPLCTFLPLVRVLSIRCPSFPVHTTTTNTSTTPTNARAPSAQLGLASTALLSRLSGLRKLYIAEFWLESFAALVDVVSAFPRLEQLELNRAVKLTRYLDSPPVDTLRHPPASLRVVKVDDWTVGHLLRWLACQACPPPLKAVHIKSIAAPQTLAIGRYLRILGPTLDSLELAFSNRDLYRAMASFHDHVDLACASRLRSIRIAVYMPWADWFLILAQLASPGLEEVIIDVWYHADDNRGSWDEMDLVFTLPQFSRLRRIRIGPMYHKPLPKPASWMRTRLPLCHRRGILEFADEGSGQDY